MALWRDVFKLWTQVYVLQLLNPVSAKLWRRVKKKCFLCFLPLLGPFEPKMTLPKVLTHFCQWFLRCSHMATRAVLGVGAALFPDVPCGQAVWVCLLFYVAVLQNMFWKGSRSILTYTGKSTRFVNRISTSIKWIFVFWDFQGHYTLTVSSRL